MSKKIILVGYGGHGFVAADILIHQGYVVYGYCDGMEKETNPYRIRYLGNENDFFSKAIHVNEFSAFVSIGSASIRQKVFSSLTVQNVNIINAIHPKSILAANTVLGKGIFIAANVVINPVCSIGNGVICNTSSSIDHECVIGDFTHICPGTVLCGNVTVGKNSFIGANSTVIPGKKIGDQVIIGAGSTVIHDLLLPGTYAGSPARLLSKAVTR